MAKQGRVEMGAVIGHYNQGTLAWNMLISAGGSSEQPSEDRENEQAAD
tara:strand:- start:5884 stop:6027 length:144 start_codon:yes stop_codon:yes gene_type:complete